MSRILLLPAVIAVALSGCAQAPKRTADAAGATASPVADAAAARDFVARINDEYRTSYPEMSSAQWIASTYINADSQLIAAKANERNLAWLNQTNEVAKAYADVPGIDDAS